MSANAMSYTGVHGGITGINALLNGRLETGAVASVSIAGIEKFSIVKGLDVGTTKMIQISNASNHMTNVNSAEGLEQSLLQSTMS